MGIRGIGIRLKDNFSKSFVITGERMNKVLLFTLLAAIILPDLNKRRRITIEP